MPQSPPSPPATATDRIRSLKDQDAIFRAFDAYPWDQDTSFLTGLASLLDAFEGEETTPDDIVQARIFYYEKRIGPSQSDGSSKPTSAPSAPTWQQTAPTSALYVDRSSDSAAATETSNDEPSYPAQFARMLKLLDEDQEIPGIKKIPNIVSRDSSVKPCGARTVPRKPWETAVASSASSGELPAALDQDFPPLNHEPSASPVESTAASA